VIDVDASSASARRKNNAWCVRQRGAWGNVSQPAAAAVWQVSADTGTAVGQVLSTAADVSRLSEETRSEVDGFLARVKAA
jgi:hypothetical protein